MIDEIGNEIKVNRLLTQLVKEELHRLVGSDNDFRIAERRARKWQTDDQHQPRLPDD